MYPFKSISYRTHLLLSSYMYCESPSGPLSWEARACCRRQCSEKGTKGSGGVYVNEGITSRTLLHTSAEGGVPTQSQHAVKQGRGQQGRQGQQG